MILDKIIKKIIQFVESITMVLMGCSIFVIVLQIVFRYVFKNPLVWSEQSARYLFIWTMSLGIPIVFYRKTIVGFDLLLKKFPSKAQFWLGMLIKLITLVFGAFYFYASISLCIKTWGSMTSGVVIPFFALYVAMPVSALLISLVMVDFIVLEVRNKISEKTEGAE